MVEGKTFCVKIFLSFSVLLNLIIVYLCYKNPVLLYELSIYESTPLIIWILYIVLLLSLYYVSIFMTNKISKNLIYLLMFIFLVSHFVFLNIPNLRGYYTWGGDHISHLYNIKNIILTGNIEVKTIYPFPYIFTSILVIFTNFDCNTIVNLVPSFFSLICIIFIFLIAKLGKLDNKSLLFAYIISTGVFLSGSTASNISSQMIFTPYGLSTTYFSVVVFLCFKHIKTNNVYYLLLAILSLISIIKYHPVVSIALSVFFIVLVEGVHIFKHENSSNIYNFKKVCNIIFLFLLNIILFIYDFLLIGDRFYLNVKLFFEEIFGVRSVIMQQISFERLLKMNFTIIDMISYLIRIHGHHFILIFLSLKCIMLFTSKKINSSMKYLYYVLFINILILGILYSFSLTGFIPAGRTIMLERLFPYSIIFSPILAGITLSYYSNKMTNKIIIIIILLMTSTVSIFNSFNSPIVYKPNILIMESEIIGTKYIIDYKIPQIDTLILLSSPYRITNGLLNKTSLLYLNLYNFERIPDHFGYDDNNTIISFQPDGAYIYYTKLDYIVYNTVYSPVGRYLYEDFEKLNNDVKLNKCYTNNNIVYLFMRH